MMPSLNNQPNQAMNREQIYREIIQKYEISEEYGKKMQMLQGMLE